MKRLFSIAYSTFCGLLFSAWLFVGLLPLGLLLLSGCASTKVLLTPAALEADSALGTSVGLQFYPQARPGLVIARDIICANAAQTNVDPNKIVSDLGAAGITNKEVAIILLPLELLYQQAWAALGTNNNAKMLPYLQSLCAGLTEGLGTMAARRHAVYLKP